MRPVLIALLAAIALAIFSTTPPGPRPASAPATAFSAERAMVHVRKVAASPHPTGSTEIGAVRAYLTRQMQQLGMVVSTDEGLLGKKSLERLASWSGQAKASVPLVNVIGVLPGRDRNLPGVMLMLHHDTVWGSPGAADNSAGLAASLEVVRALKSRGQPLRDIVILATDGEELGLDGSTQFFAQNPLRLRIGAIINLEARGGGGRASLFQTSRQNGEAARTYASAVSRPAASSLSAYVYSVLPNNTDLTPALDGPYAAYNIAFIGRPGLYHSPLATPERLDRGALQDMGQQTLDLTDRLANARELPGKADDAVFFDVFGLFTVIWPAWLGWPMLGLIGLLLFVVVRREGTPGLVAGAARMLALLAGSAIAFYAFNRLSIGTAEPEYYDRLAAIPLLEVVAALAGAASVLAAFGRIKATPTVTVGAALPLLVLALAGQALAPTAAYVLIVPLILVAAALAARKGWAAIAAAAAVVGYMIALAHQLMQGIGPDTPMACALPLALAALALLPLWPGMDKKAFRTAIVVSLLGATAVAVWVWQDASAETQAVYARA